MELPRGVIRGGGGQRQDRMDQQFDLVAFIPVDKTGSSRWTEVTEKDLGVGDL